MNVVHVRFQGGSAQPTATDLATLDTKLVKLWSGAAYAGGAAWFTLVPGTTTLLQITYYVLDGTSPALIQSHVASGTGGSSSQASEVAHVLTLRTPNRGRRYRGRIFLPAAGSVNITAGGTLVSTAITTTLAQFDGLRTDLATVNWAIGVASYGHSTDKAGVEHTWTPFFTDTAAGIQGRSMDAVGDVIRHRKG